jgi:hypothetical protein
MTKTLAEQLEQRPRGADLWRPLERSRVECLAGRHRCPTSPGFAGVGKVRYNRRRKLYTRHGYVNAVYCDPIEKKMTGAGDTPAATPIRAGQIGQSALLRCVDAGDARGCIRDLEDTFGPGCRPSVIERRGFRVLHNRVSAQGKCPDCGEASGAWGLPGRNGDETADWLHIRLG